MKKLLTSIVLAGALAFGVGGCEKEKEPDYFADFRGYQCEVSKEAEKRCM